VMEALRALDEAARRSRAPERSRKTSRNSSSDEGRGHSLG
jgi:hypothetical protein